uniref:Uncharacterized protein n=1 Tax=Glossina palpalis gambiensis TaxID=67801 RepID=A0A1B0B1C8_9MUSC
MTKYIIERVRNAGVAVVNLVLAVCLSRAVILSTATSLQLPFSKTADGAAACSHVICFEPFILQSVDGARSKPDVIRTMYYGEIRKIWGLSLDDK